MGLAGGGRLRTDALTASVFPNARAFWAVFFPIWPDLEGEPATAAPETGEPVGGRA